MTNAEKYLKDNVDIDDFYDAYEKYKDIHPYPSNDDGCETYSADHGIVHFLRDIASPTISYKQKEILNCIDKRYTHLQRMFCDKQLYCFDNKENKWIVFPFSSDVFDFILVGEEYKISDLLKE